MDSTGGLTIPTTTEAEGRARVIENRRRRLAADLRAEGANEATVERLATASAAERMVDYETKTIDFIFENFGARPTGAA